MDNQEFEEWKEDQRERLTNMYERGEITRAEYQRRLIDIADPRKAF